MTFAFGDLVEHRTDHALGQGRVTYAQTFGGVVQIGVMWASSTHPAQHTAAELIVVRPLAERLREVGPASRVPFQLKVFGRWFEARHALTGELSNQPFQMLPHQVVVTNRVVNSAPDNRAWLIADDVGLGKTIEAGMIMEVLRKRTFGGFRCLIVAPAGLVPQWIDEMNLRFRRKFMAFKSDNVNLLDSFDQLVASIDTLKLAKFKAALETSPPWDLVIFDEAHHLATTSSVLTHKLAQSIFENKKARNVLFLSATPHSGNNEHFFNMLRLLRKDLFPPGQKKGFDYPHVSLKQVMIRNRKSEVTDVHGQKIFKGIGGAKIIPFAPTREEIDFYEELQTYLKTGYKAADRFQKEKDGQKASAVGFLMSTFGKLASSSRAAIESALENRLSALRGENGDENASSEIDERFSGEQAVRAVATTAIDAAPMRGKKKKESVIGGEIAFVERLLERLRTLQGPDSKLTAFIDRVNELPPDVKLLIFTEYRATQDVLVDALSKTFGKDAVVTINGSMDMADRRQKVDAFNEKRPNPRFMVSTEAGGEGLNMQKSCHTVVNYDLPWNPMALQQRIGRVYRYGQQSPVTVLNLKVESTSEAFADQRVYDYLEKKIDEITLKLSEVQDGNAEDLRGEVLGQVASQISLDDIYKTAVEEGRSKAEKQIDMTASHVEQILADPKGMLGLFKGLERFDISDYEKVAARVSAAHLGFFVRQYLGLHGSEIGVSRDGLLSFKPPRPMIDVANNLVKSDPYQVREPLTDAKIERATVDKEFAQRMLGCRLLRFGDSVFEAMVRHVQHGRFAGVTTDGVATLELSSKTLGWPTSTTGTWVLFDVRVVRQEGSAGGARVLRHELASYLVPNGGAPIERDDIVEGLHEALDGPLEVDTDEARRAYQAAREAADLRLREMYNQVVTEFGTDMAILPQEVQDVALAWVLAS